jgi:hypothetical protein
MIFIRCRTSITVEMASISMRNFAGHCDGREAFQFDIDGANGYLDFAYLGGSARKCYGTIYVGNRPGSNPGLRSFIEISTGESKEPIYTINHKGSNIIGSVNSVDVSPPTLQLTAEAGKPLSVPFTVNITGSGALRVVAVSNKRDLAVRTPDGGLKNIPVMGSAPAVLDTVSLDSGTIRTREYTISLSGLSALEGKYTANLYLTVETI